MQDYNWHLQVVELKDPSEQVGSITIRLHSHFSVSQIWVGGHVGFFKLHTHPQGGYFDHWWKYKKIDYIIYIILFSKYSRENISVISFYKLKNLTVLCWIFIKILPRPFPHYSYSLIYEKPQKSLKPLPLKHIYFNSKTSK